MSKNNQNFKNKKFANQKQQKPAVSTSPAASSKPSSKKSSQGSTILPKLERWLPLIYFLLFSLMAFIYLAVLNKDYLYGCQEHSIWQNNREFFDDQMRVVGGFSQWLGCYFTQYFYHPWLGSLILIALWGLIYLLSLIFSAVIDGGQMIQPAFGIRLIPDVPAVVHELNEMPVTGSGKHSEPPEKIHLDLVAVQERIVVKSVRIGCLFAVAFIVEFVNE